MAVASEPYTPSVLVGTEGLPEKEWLEYRRRGIGGSDAAAILGISPFATARDLYYDKLKIVPFDDSESNWVILCLYCVYTTLIRITATDRKKTDVEISTSVFMHIHQSFFNSSRKSGRISKMMVQITVQLVSS